MKIKYTPGTPEGLNGKSYTIEIISLDLHRVPFLSEPVLKQVQIKYEDGTIEWVDGMKLMDSIDNNKVINTRVR